MKKTYVPPGTRAANAIAANPGKSDRAIADEIGVAHATVSRARKATVSGETVQPRTGKDGKVRKLPRRPDDPNGGAEPDDPFAAARRLLAEN